MVSKRAAFSSLLLGNGVVGKKPAWLQWGVPFLVVCLTVGSCYFISHVLDDEALIFGLLVAVMRKINLDRRLVDLRTVLSSALRICVDQAMAKGVALACQPLARDFVVSADSTAPAGLLEPGPERGQVHPARRVHHVANRERGAGEGLRVGDR